MTKKTSYPRRPNPLLSSKDEENLVSTTTESTSQLEAQKHSQAEEKRKQLPKIQIDPAMVTPISI